MTGRAITSVAPVIYKILDRCDNRQLEPIVEILVGSTVSFLKHTRAFERHSPDHFRYTDQIGDEIYRLGQRSLGVTDGSRPSYQRIIAALCKQLSVPCDENDLAGNESTLLNLFTPQRLASIAPNEQQAAVSDAAAVAAKGASSFFGAEEWGPLASTMMHVAFLRQQLLNTNESTSAATVSTPRIVDANDREELVISADDGTPILKFSSVNIEDEDGWQKISQKDEGISQLSPFLQMMPSVATRADIGTTNYMNVIVPAGKELVFAKKDGGLIGVLKDSASNHLSGGAKLEAGNLMALANAGVALNVASALLAQKHLADISQKLTEIKEAIEDVSAFQKDERRSVLTGSIRYFEQIAPAVLAGELSDEVANTIESHEADLLKIQDHLAVEIRSQTDRLKAIKDEAWVGQVKYMKSLEDQQLEIGKLYEEMLLCLRARACGWQLMSAFPGRDIRKESRLRDISKAVEAIKPQGSSAVALDRTLREKIKKISKVSDQSKFIKSANEFLDRISDQGEIIIGSLTKISSDIKQNITPLSFDLKIEDGTVVAIKQRA